MIFVENLSFFYRTCIKRKFLKKIIAFMVSFSLIFFNIFGCINSFEKINVSASVSGSAASRYIRSVFENIKISKESNITKSYGGGVDSKKSRNIDPINYSDFAKVYFGGNEFHVINTETSDSSDYVYLLAAKPYLWLPFKSTFYNDNCDKTYSRNSYSNSLIEEYLTSNKTTENTTPYEENLAFFSEIDRGYAKEDFVGTSYPASGKLGRLKQSKLENSKVTLKKINGDDATSFYNDFFTNRLSDLEALVKCNVVSTFFQFYNLTGNSVDSEKINLNGTTDGKAMQTKSNECNFWLPSAGLNSEGSPLICVHPSYDFNPLKGYISGNSLPFCVKLNDVLPSVNSGLGSTLVRTPSENFFCSINSANSDGIVNTNTSFSEINSSNIGCTNGLYPACKLDLSKVVYISNLSEEENSLNDSNVKDLSKGFTLPYAQTLSDTTKDNSEDDQKYVLTIKSKSSDGINNNLIKNFIINENSDLIIETSSKVPENKYLGVLLDDGNKVRFINLKNINPLLDVYTIPQTGFDSKLTQIKIYLCEDNEQKATKFVNDSFKIKYAQEIANKIVSDYTFDQTDHETGVRVQGNFPPGSKLVVRTHEDDPDYFKLLERNIDEPEKVDRYIAYDIVILDKDNIEIEDNFGTAKVWLPVPADFDIEDIEARFISKDKDEIKNSEIVNTNSSDKDKSLYLVFNTDHFSPYAIIDRNSSYYDDYFKNPRTGYNYDIQILCLVTFGSIIMATLIFSKKKYKENI